MAIAVGAAGIATGLAMAAGLQTAGLKGALAPTIAVLGLLLLRFPGVAFGLLIAGSVVVEGEAPGLVPPFGSFYDVAIASLTPQDLLLVAGLAGVLLAFAVESRRPRLPDPLIAPLALLGLAIVAGAATGYAAHAGVSQGELFHRSMTASYLILVPLLAVNVLRDTRALRICLAIGAALAAFKAVSGLYAAFGGIGSVVEDETVTYLSPVPNFVMLVFVLGVAAALVRRVRLPTWALAGAPLALLALLLSYRRSFWIAAAFTLIVVVVIASRRRGRAVVALLAVALALGVGGTLLVGAGDRSGDPLNERVQTLSPSGIGTNRGDRYRMDERRNVIRNIREHPLTGIGLGVPWTVHYPLAEAHDRRYAHFALLWFWLAFGPLGAIAYVALMAAGLWTAVRVWRHHPDPLVQVGAIAAFGGLLGLVIVELTATFTAVEPRTSLVLGGLLGWLAAAWFDIPAPEPKPSRAALAAPPA
ncbi:MAG TPA: O-antigen ligase family protein [Solirubrobacterales bacterium]|nr:O-antigen ligase family protein [Solirubrobacterales bacterium]